MVANNYLNEGRTHPKVIDLIVLGFTGKLLQWWNNCLTEHSKEDIKTAVQKNEEDLPIFEDPPGRGIPDGVNTLIYTIINHFVGKPSNITSRIYDQLSNLRCRTLGDYRWYEDMFTTRVMNRSDCNSPFWKEKFINGLPTLFGEKVKETLCNSLREIDYDSLTYGDISSTIRSVGMKMCRDFKIHNKASKSKANSSSDHEIYQQSSSEPSRNYSSSSEPRIDLACKSSCCRNLNTLSKKESILNLIEQIEDPIIKAQKLAQFNKSSLNQRPEPLIKAYKYPESKEESLSILNIMEPVQGI
ncbi:hypothetical protein SO802_024426 [Lithocarpus litseifolius]|uniref:DUF7746 domain-containing protein n=1 Tax=Lithocarpus litseifolius TaxID=425828 RepID=A0AAW2CAJ9_9ROSI